MSEKVVIYLILTVKPKDSDFNFSLKENQM